MRKFQTLLFAYRPQRSPFKPIKTCARRLCNGSGGIETPEYVQPVVDLAAAKKDIASETRQDAEWLTSLASKLALGKSSIPSQCIDLEVNRASGMNITSFLKARQFDLSSPSETRILSSLVTYPLTLASALHEMLLSDSMHPDSRGGISSLNILVCGARAESGLPLLWWKEALFACPIHIERLNIVLQGPHLMQPRTRKHSVVESSKPSAHVAQVESSRREAPSEKQPQQQQEQLQQQLRQRMFMTEHTQTFKWQCDQLTADETKVTKELTLTHLQDGKCPLHTHPKLISVLEGMDVFVLFNPGMGATDELRASWRPSIAALLRTHKPIILTALSLQDLLRDATYVCSVIDDLVAQDADLPRHLAADAVTSRPTNCIQLVLDAQENDFASLKRSFDDKEIDACKVVTTNGWMWIMHGHFSQEHADKIGQDKDAT